MKNQTLTHAELHIQTSATVLELNQPRRTTTTLLSPPDADGKGARLLIVEKEYTPRPEQQWTPCGKTLHLTLKHNASHVQIIGYVRREEIKSNRQLGDLLCLEAEQLSAALEDADEIQN